MAEAAPVQLASRDMLPILLRREDSRTAANKQIISGAAARFSWICPATSRICCYSAPGHVHGGDFQSRFWITLGSEFREYFRTGAASAMQKRQIRPCGESSQGKSSPALAVCVDIHANAGAGSRPQGRSLLRMDVARFGALNFISGRTSPWDEFHPDPERARIPGAPGFPRTI